jgi:3-hydroxybutyryl-CoA dehydrogenase
MTRTEQRIIGVVGAGAMGRGIAQWAAQAGFAVILHDANLAAAMDAVASITAHLHRLAAKGTLSEGAAYSCIERIAVADGIGAFAPADIVIEAIVERLDAKQSLFAALEHIVSDTCIIATNTSSLSVSAIASAAARPDRIAGLHFFNPVLLMRVVEVIAGERTAPVTIDLLCEIVARAGHRAIRCQDTPGFLINHAGRGLSSEGLRIVQEGIADYAMIDRLIRDAAGFRMGPFELMDLTGLDVSFAVMETIYNQFYQEPRFRPSPLPARRVAAGLLGRKTGEGFYRYTDDKPEPDPASPPTALRSLWISPSARPALRSIERELIAAGIPLDDADRPMAGSVCIVAPWGVDATMTAIAETLDPARTVAIDPLFVERATTLMLTATTTPDYRDAAVAALTRISRPVSVINDSPGFVVQRVLATIVNIACDIAQQRIASPDDIDAAVQLGLGYPAGPLTLGDRIGAANIMAILEAMHGFYGDPRYRPSPWLRRRAALGQSLTTPEAARH